MIPVEIVSIISLLYIGLLFVVAYFAEKRREAGRSVISNPYIYSLSLAVLYNSWAYYGLVGQAATVGISFLGAYLGPTLMAFIWPFLLLKMVRVSKEQNILNIADFISSRYSKSLLLGSIVTVFSIMAIMPNLALQLKAVAYTFDLLSQNAGGGLSKLLPALPRYIDTAFIAALFLALFAILFGARHLNASERHEGLVAALALQSLIKLVAFVAVGIFVTYGMFDGITDIFTRFTAQFPGRADLFLLGTAQVPYTLWFSWLFFPMMAFMFLPHQFHIMVIENSDERHIRHAMWLFPAYSVLFALFVMPIALGGTIVNGGDTATADFFAIHLPLHAGHPWLALLVFIGGFSASAGMVMLESLVLSTMILNYLVIPLILKLKIEISDMSRILINLKRLGIIAIVLLGHLYYRLIGEPYTLINIGVISLIAACQFAPSIIGGLYWKDATRRGALAGLILGFILWFYTLVLPLLVQTSWFYDKLLPLLVQWGWLERDILQDGPFGLAFLRPQALFGLSGLDMLSHSLFWTLFFNLGAFLAISILTTPDKSEAEQAVKFVDVFETREEPALQRMSKAPTIMEFAALLTKFIGEKQAHAAIVPYIYDRHIDERGSLSEYELPALKRFTERVLAGSVGAAAAGVIVESYFAARGSEMEDVFDIFGTVTLSRTASREQLGVLYEAAKIVASGEDLLTIQDNILKLLQEQFKFETCLIRILDEGQRRLMVQGHRGMSLQHFDESVLELNLETYAGEAILTNAVVVINDTAVMDKSHSARVVRQEGIKSFAHAPIMIEGKAVGLLSAFSKSMEGIFTEEFIELFKSLAGQIGIALRNARQTETLIQAKEHEKEMKIAKTIQLGLLPTRAPDVMGISLVGICLPAHEVGGDYYDFLARGTHALDLVIADVSGHNVGAALMMAETRAFIQAGVMSLQRPSEILNSLNELLYEDLTRAELFISMFYLNYNAEVRKLAFASAGHNPPVVWRGDSESCEWLDAEGMILGVKRKVLFEEKLIQLYPGDMLLLYTDGITEAANPAGEFFGEDRLCAVLKENRTFPPQELIDNLLERVRSFVEAESFVDDITLVVMRVEK